MLFDLHAHSSGISHCCRIPAEEVIHRALAVGLDGIVLTNHYQDLRNYFNGGSCDDFARRYVAEYEYAKQWGEKLGCRVLFGVEVTMEQYNNEHLLVYGVSPNFVLVHPDLYDMTQKDLYAAVKAEGGAVIQAHSLRKGSNVLMDPSFLDGVELNCHPGYDGTHAEELAEFAVKHGSILTCGGDYHADTYRPHCGVSLPDTVQTEADLAAYLRNTEQIDLRIHEPNSQEYTELTFLRGKGLIKPTVYPLSQKDIEKEIQFT
ncbi:MAG: PHP domain-containing protein [Ruminococcaceae bacterium]|nr:PHP domain-containing protein [Oscillospiraceae bacterium]